MKKKTRPKTYRCQDCKDKVSVISTSRHTAKGEEIYADVKLCAACADDRTEAFYRRKDAL